MRKNVEKYRLREQLGDMIQYEIAPLIEEHFPNYEIFYSKYIFNFRDSMGWQVNMCPIFEEIGMADYAILKSLNYVRRAWIHVVTGDPNQTFKNIYFHFGLVLDSVEHMGRHILRLQDELQIINLKGLIKDKKKISGDLSNWVEKKYDGEIDSYIKTGKLPSPPKGTERFMELLLKDANLYSEYERVSRALRGYRNMFTHNPIVDIFTVPKNGIKTQLCPKKDKVEKYHLWSDMQLKCQSNDNDFADPYISINNDFLELLALLNKVYEEYDKHMVKIFTNNGVERLLPNYRIEKTI